MIWIQTHLNRIPIGISQNERQIFFCLSSVLVQTLYSFLFVVCFWFFFKIYFLLCIPTPVSLPFSCPPNSSPSCQPSTRQRPSLVSQQRLEYQPEAATSPSLISRLRKLSHQKDSSCTCERSWCDYQRSSPTDQDTQLSPTLRVSSLVPCKFPSCQSIVCGLPLARVSCLCSFPHCVFDPLVSYDPSSLSATQLQQLSQCLAVGYCIWFHHLLGIVSMMTVSYFAKLLERLTKSVPVHYWLHSSTNQISYLPMSSDSHCIPLIRELRPAWGK